MVIFLLGKKSHTIFAGKKQCKTEDRKKVAFLTFFDIWNFLFKPEWVACILFLAKKKNVFFPEIWEKYCLISSLWVTCKLFREKQKNDNYGYGQPKKYPYVGGQKYWCKSSLTNRYFQFFLVQHSSPICKGKEHQHKFVKYMYRCIRFKYPHPPALPLFKFPPSPPPPRLRAIFRIWLRRFKYPTILVYGKNFNILA